MTEMWAMAWGHDVESVVADFQRFEAAGCAGVSFSDSQNLWFDTWVAVTLAARETERIKLGPIVTTPLTRHPAVTAGAAASANEVADGRVVLGVGRGDSAHAYLGHSLTPFTGFRSWLERTQTYLRGEAVAFDPSQAPNVPPLADLGYANVPTDSKIQWLPTSRPPVPVVVAASGPRMVDLAARTTQGVVLGMGANHDRLASTIAVARQAAAEAGNDDFTIGAMVPVLPHPDADVALRLGQGAAQTMARWSVMDGGNRDMDPDKRAQAEAARTNYDMTRHGSGGQAPAADETMARDYAVFGTPDECIAQLEAMAVLGVERFHFPCALRGGSPELRATVKDLLFDHVVPAVS